MTRTNAIAALVLVGGLAGSHWFTFQAGNSYGKNALQVNIQAETIRKLNARITANSALADQYRQQAEQGTRNYEQELAAIRATAARNNSKRVPVGPGIFRGLALPTETTTTGTAGSTDPGTWYLPESFATDLRELARDADEITAAYRSLRERSAACFE